MPKGIPPEHGKFKPGQSGNPNGRPRKLPEIREVIGRVLGEEKDGVTACETIFLRWRQLAAQGNLKAGELLISYAYGRPTQRLELPVELPKDISINIIHQGTSPQGPVTDENDIIEPEPPPTGGR